MKKLTDPETFEVDALLERLEWEQRRQDLALWREQQRQYKPVYIPKWGAILAALFVFGAVAYVLWHIYEAWPRLMGALR